MSISKEIVLDVAVTQEDIFKGIRGDCGHCPIARALGRALEEKFGETCPFVVDGCGLSFKIPKMLQANPARPWACNHTLETGKFIQEFDAGRQVAPDEFRLVFT